MLICTGAAAQMSDGQDISEVANLEALLPWLSTPTYILPPDQDAPVAVTVGVHVHEVTNIQLREQNFTSLIHLSLSWNDPRLAFSVADVGTDKLHFTEKTTQRVLDDIWYPSVVVANAITVPANPRSLLTVHADGEVWLDSEISVTAQYHANMRTFPFDQQTLEIILAPFNPRDHVIDLKPRPLPSASVEAVGVPVGYQPSGAAFGRQERSLFDEGAQPVLVFGFDIQRESRHYLWRFMAPIVALVFISYTTFWMRDTQLHDRLKVIAISVLAIVTFMLVVNRDLPRVPYLTTLGLFYVFMWILPAIAIVQAMFVSHFQATNRPERAARWDQHMRWLYPLLLVLSIVPITVYAFSFS